MDDMNNLPKHGEPTSKVFISYRRSRVTEIAALVSALRERGVPVWQDLSDLATTHTEEALKTVLESSDVSGAIIWLTPDVEQSDVIRKIEIPKIVHRETAAAGFFVVPVLAGGLDYKDVEKICGPFIGAENLGAWNLMRLTNDPAAKTDVQDVSKKTLNRRLAELNRSLPENAHIDVNFYARVPPPAKPVALTIDWRHHFQGRHAAEADWENILLPALEEIATAIGTHANSRTCIFRGKVPLSAAFSLGATIPSTRGIKAEWVQEFPSGETQAWSLSAARLASGFTSTSRGSDASGRDIAILISVTQDVENAFGLSKASLPTFRAILKISNQGVTTTQLGSPGEAMDIASVVRDAVLAAKREYPDAGGLHIFMAVPAGAAFLIGQLSNTFGPIQLYELDQTTAAIGTYRPSAKING